MQLANGSEAEARKQRAVVDEIKQAGGQVYFDYQLDASGKDIPNAEPPEPAWLRRLLGDDVFVTMVAVDPTVIGRLDSFNFRSHIIIPLEHLKGLTQLEETGSRNTSPATPMPLV